MYIFGDSAVFLITSGLGGHCIAMERRFHSFGGMMEFSSARTVAIL